MCLRVARFNRASPNGCGFSRPARACLALLLLSLFSRKSSKRHFQQHIHPIDQPTIVVYLHISGLRCTLNYIVIIALSPTVHLLKEMMKLPYDKISCALTPSIKSNSEVGNSSTVPSSSKRRRVSNEENNGPTPVTLLGSFIDSVSSYRDEDTRKKARNQHIDSDSDDEEEEDIREDDDHHHDENFAKKLAHEKSKQLLLERITRANSQSTSMEGEFDELVMVISKAKLYENKEGGWIDRGLCAIKFLRDVEEGENSFGMIRMRLVMTNLNERITLKIDDFEVRLLCVFFFGVWKRYLALYRHIMSDLFGLPLVVNLRRLA